MEVLLLEDRLRDGEVVAGVLEMLDKSGSLKVVVLESHALGFFSHSETQPLGIVLFLNGQEAIGIYPDSNYNLMKSDAFGINRLCSDPRYRVNNAAQRQVCFITYLMGLHADDAAMSHLNN
ncbi:MAG: hypothetical protein RL226_2149 [Bacteroidota bacterium]|jgi:hypothetical protein